MQKHIVSFYTRDTWLISNPLIYSMHAPFKGEVQMDNPILLYSLTEHRRYYQEAHTRHARFGKEEYIQSRYESKR